MDSIAVPIALTLELRPEGADIGSLERAVSVALAEAGQRLWAELDGCARSGSLSVPAGHPGCGGILQANGRAPRRIVTLAGEVGGATVVATAAAPAAESSCRSTRHLGLEPRSQHTLGVRERALWLATELSYAQDRPDARGAARSRGQPWPGAPLGGRGGIASRGRGGGPHQRPSSGAHPERVGLSPSARRRRVGQADGTMVHDRGERDPRGGPAGPRLQRAPNGSAGTDGGSSSATTWVPPAHWTTFAERLVAACAAMGVYEAGPRPLRLGRGARHPLDLGTGLPRRDRAARLVPPGRAPALRGSASQHEEVHSSRPSVRQCPATSRPSSPSCAAHARRARARRSRAGPALPGRHRLRRRATARGIANYRIVPLASARAPWRRASTSPSAAGSRAGA